MRGAVLRFEISQRVGERLMLNGKPVTIEELHDAGRKHLAATRTDREWKASQPSLSDPRGHECGRCGCQTCWNRCERLHTETSEACSFHRQQSLSAAIGAVIERTKAEPDFRSRETQ